MKPLATLILRLSKIAIVPVIFMLVGLSVPLAASPLACNDIQVIFARGSGESLNGENFQSFLANLKPVIRRHAPSLKVDYHELNYPAVGVDGFGKVLSTAITAGEAFEFNDSVADGQARLKNHLQEVNLNCPATKFILAGYSQGAMVISKTLPELKSSQIIYAATFGDPKLFLPEGLGLSPDACHGKNLSNYRQTVPDCYTDKGILTALKNYQPQGYKDKLGAWCNAGDFMCGSYFDLFGGIMKSHTSYASNGAYQEAARVIIASIKKYFPQLVSKEIKLNYSINDVAVLIDATQSMERTFRNYYTQALTIAEQTIANGGRVALFTFGDLSERATAKLCDFTADLNTFQSALDTIKLEGGGDNSESALSALLYTMNKLQWQKGANKAVILLTDTSYHSPDLDGTTLPQVVQRSLEIDPVNVFATTVNHMLWYYQPLTKATGGATYLAGPNVIQPVLARPHLQLNQEFYAATTNDTLSFTVTSSSPINHYEWDLDGDGEFESTTADSTVTHTYTAPFNKYIQVKAVPESGLAATASALVRIKDPMPATITKLSSTPGIKSAQLEFQAQNTAAVLIIANDTLMGHTTDSSLELTELNTPLSVKLIPISPDGTLGEPAYITATPKDFEATVPRTGVR